MPALPNSSKQPTWTPLRTRDRFATVDHRHPLRGKTSTEIDLTAGDRRIDLGGRRPLNIADVGKAFRAQQFLDDELRGMTDRRGAHKSHRGGFQALLCGDCRRSEHPGGAGQ
jgi:hypothetical protein